MTPGLAIVLMIACFALRARQNRTSNQLSRRLLSLRRKRSRGVCKRAVRPGRGVPLAGQKAPYQHRQSTKRYESALEDENWFHSVVHMTVNDFEALFELVKLEKDSPLNPWNQLTAEQRLGIRKKKKKLTARDLLFLFLDVMGGGSCGADTFFGMANKYGTSPGTIWKYIYHTTWAVFRGLNQHCPIVWPNVDARKAMHGLIRGFPEAVLFCDGTRQPVFRSVYDDVQNDQFYGKDKIHCFGILVYVDVYGLIRRIEVTFSGRLHDKTMFQLSDVYLNKKNTFPLVKNFYATQGFWGLAHRTGLCVHLKKELV